MSYDYADSELDASIINELKKRIEALEAALRERDVDIAFCREAMRHADIDLTMALPMLTTEMQRAARKTLDRIDEARLRSLAPEQDK